MSRAAARDVLLSVLFGLVLDLAALAGAGLVLYGLARISPPIAWIGAGVFLIGLSYLLSRRAL